MVMKKLKGFLKWVKEVVFVFNRHAGLLKSIKIDFPSAPLSYCIVHLKANLRKTLGGMETKRKKHLLNLFYLCVLMHQLWQDLTVCLIN